MNVLKVSAKSLPNSVAGAIAGVIRENNEVEIQAVGAGATNQAIKSIAIAWRAKQMENVDVAPVLDWVRRRGFFAWKKAFSLTQKTICIKL